MKRDLALVAFLTLFLILIANPAPYSMPLAIGHELNEKPFFTAADGAESSESLTIFSETSADDTRLYPDADSAIGFNELSSSSVLNENETDVVWNDPGPIWWRPYRSGGYSNTGGASNSTMIEMWANKSTPLGPVEIEVCYYLNTSIVLTNNHLFYIKLMAEVVGNYRIGFYNGSTEHYTASFPIAAETWTIITALDLGNIVTGTVSRITVENDPTASYGAGANHSIWVDYHHLTDIPVVTNEDIYAESFADVSDWAWQWAGGLDAGQYGFGTDGDVGEIWIICNDTGDEFVQYDYELSSPVTIESYIEIRFKSETSGIATDVFVYDSGSTAYTVLSTGLTTSWITSKIYLGSTVLTDIAKIRIRATDYPSAIATGNLSMCFEYLRIGSADEMGWQHDGSTTAGLVDDLYRMTVASDGDIATFTTTTGSGRSKIYFDTTATVSNSDPDYYPFVHLSVTECDADWVLTVYFDDDSYSMLHDIASDTGDFHYNLKAVAGTKDIKCLYFMVNAATSYAKVDFFQLYSIANFTVTQSASCSTADVVYVDTSGNLVLDRATTAWVVLEIDPAPSITISTYSVWNITKSGSEGFGIRTRGSPSWDWGTAQYGETRGATADLIGSSDTSIIDLQIHSQTVIGICTISALKFIEDGTAPSVLRISATPPEPDDTESVTLSALATDTVEVYKVWFRPITGPTGYSQTDYESTEQTDNLWTYEFSNLDEGYWAFKAIAHDGANNSTVDADSVIDFWVREKELKVTRPLLTVGGSTVQLSGDINMGASYEIFEDSASVGSGSVSTAGSFSISWTRASATAAADVSVEVRFTNGSFTESVYGVYSKALETAFKIEEWDIDLHIGEHSYVDFEVRTTWGNATVQAYDNNTLMTTVTEEVGGITSYFWLEGAGLHTIVLNITAGGTTFTRTKPVDVPDWASGALVVRWDLTTFQDNYTLIELESTWRNCTYYVYMNDSLVATSYNDPVTLNFTRAINIGEYNLTIYADGGAQTYSILNIRYIVTEEGVSYDYSSVTGGVTNVEGDTYEGDIVTINENPTGVFIDQGTAAIVSVGGFLIIFTAFLVARELKHREREKTERTYSQ